MLLLAGPLVALAVPAGRPDGISNIAAVPVLAPTNAAPIKLAADSAWLAKPPTHRWPAAENALLELRTPPLELRTPPPPSTPPPPNPAGTLLPYPAPPPPPVPDSYPFCPAWPEGGYKVDAVSPEDLSDVTKWWEDNCPDRVAQTEQYAGVQARQQALQAQGAAT